MSQAASSINIPLTRHPALVLRLDTPKGRGVFAQSAIPSGAVLETCPVLIFSEADNEQHIARTELYHYTYNWPLAAERRTAQALVLGLGSMFNHSTREQNVGWTRDLAGQLITYHALRDIEPGEELCISYGSRLTFADVDRMPESAGVDDEVSMLNRVEY